MEVHAGWMPPSEEPPAGVQAFQELQVKFIQLTSQQKHVRAAAGLPASGPACVGRASHLPVRRWRASSSR